MVYKVIVGRGVVFSWVVISLFVENNDISVELELRIGGIGRVLVRTVVGGSLRQIWRGGGEVEVEAIVDGEVWGTVGLILVVYIVMAVHGGGGIVAFLEPVQRVLAPSLAVYGDRDEDWKEGEKKRGRRVSRRNLKLRPLSGMTLQPTAQRSLSPSVSRRTLGDRLQTGSFASLKTFSFASLRFCFRGGLQLSARHSLT